MNPIIYFPKDSQLRKADTIVNRYLGGSINMNLLFTGDIKSPKILKRMDQLQSFIKDFSDVGSAMSIATIIKKINRALNEDKPEFEVIPKTRKEVAQAILLYSMASSPYDFELFVDNSFSHAQIIALLKGISTGKIAKIVKEAEKFYKDRFSEKIEVKFTGFSVLLTELGRLIIISLIITIFISASLVFFITFFTFRSWSIGLMAVIPLLIAIIVNFGLTGLLGIELSIPIAMISSIIIGIGIDFSFHFLYRFKLELKRVKETSPIIKTVCTAGKAILFDALPTAFGILVLLFSTFVPLRYFGFLMALIMMVCAFGAITIFPAILSIKKERS
jgi:hypothetical protein